MYMWRSRFRTLIANPAKSSGPLIANAQLRRQYMTQVVLLLMFSALALFTLVIASGWGIGAFGWSDVAIMLALDIPTCVCLVLARTGYWRVGGYFAPLLMVGLGVFGSFVGGLGTVFVIFYGLAILLAGMLIGNRTQWLTVILCIAAHTRVAAVYHSYAWEDYLPVIITLSGGFVGVALLQWLSTQQLEQALAQAHATAVDLREEVTVRTQTEHALRESQTLLRLIFDRAFDGISVYEEYPEFGTRRLVDCNARYAEIAGRSREELLSLDDILPLQESIEPKIDRQQVLEWSADRVYVGRFRWLRPDTKENVVEYAAVSLQVDDRLLVVGVDRDITEQLQATQEREALINELEAKNDELEQFAYTVSHDLKSPLITIKGFLHFLEQDAMGGDATKVGADIAFIANAVDKMQQLLDELLELSRLGRLINPPQDIPMSELACEAVELVSGQLMATGVQVDVVPDMPVVRGDRPRLREVYENLLGNAAKFMGDQPHPRVEVGVRRDSNQVVFYVRDNGIGIEPQHREKVFGLFEKVDSDTDGTGIGLAIVKRIVETHAGRIWVESAGLGRGSAFCFTLPGPSVQS